MLKIGSGKQNEGRTLWVKTVTYSKKRKDGRRDEHKDGRRDKTSDWLTGRKMKE